MQRPKEIQKMTVKISRNQAQELALAICEVNVLDYIKANPTEYENWLSEQTDSASVLELKAIKAAKLKKKTA